VSDQSSLQHSTSGHSTIGPKLAWIAFAFAVGVFILFVVLPFLWPIPEQGDLVADPRELARSDSQFVNVDGLDIHYISAGEGDTALVFLHGLGGRAHTFSEIMPELESYGKMIAFDRPGFGLSERPEPPFNNGSPYAPERQTELVIGLLNELGISNAVLVGHSAGGAVALDVAYRAPHRVDSLVLIAPSIYTRPGVPTYLKPILRLPQARRIGPYLVRRLVHQFAPRYLHSSWHDPDGISPETFETYFEITRLEGWDQALYEYIAAAGPPSVQDLVPNVAKPTLVITGDNDPVVPTTQSVRLSSELPAAQLVVITECGHVPHEECPDLTVAAIRGFLDRLHLPTNVVQKP